jgi:hypothetical protein
LYGCQQLHHQVEEHVRHLSALLTVLAIGENILSLLVLDVVMVGTDVNGLGFGVTKKRGCNITMINFYFLPVLLE